MAPEEPGCPVPHRGFKSNICLSHRRLSWIATGISTSIVYEASTGGPGMTLKKENIFRLEVYPHTPG